MVFAATAGNSVDTPYTLFYKWAVAFIRAENVKRMRVLLIEDNEDAVHLIRDALTEATAARFDLARAESLAIGLQHLSEGGIDGIDVVLLDLSLPDSHGLETIHTVHAHRPEIPIVVLTGIEDDTLAVEAVQAGAQDYLVKGQINGNLLVRAIRYAVERKRAQEQIRDMAYHDELTKLPNRRLFLDRLELALTQARRKRQLLAVMLMDLDGFKLVNDSLGHAKGDLLLQRVGDRLKACIRSGDTVARLGGDEFTILLPELAQADDAARSANKILDAFTRPFVVEDQELAIGTSVGISLYPADGTDAATLLKNADSAMYRAKKQGGNTYQLCTPAMKVRASERLTLERNLRQALDQHEFIVYYQPLVDLRSGKIFGAEAVVRWQHPEQGLISPAGFIAVAIETGLIVPLGLSVLRTACAQVKAWHTRGYPLRVAVNLAARQVRQEDFVTQVTKVMNETGLAPEWLDVEITEQMAMRNLGVNSAVFDTLSSLMVQVSMEDFGAGHSPLSEVKQYPPKTLKIDQAFIKGIGAKSRDTDIVKAVIDLAHSMDMKVIAEGVETQEELDFLRAHRCDAMQGYLFSPPVPPGVFEQFLVQGKCLPPGA